MGRVSTAFLAFFRSLFNAETASRVQEALRPPANLTHETKEVAPSPPASTTSVIQRKTTQSEAITLLATLQREARLVDFLQENLSGYSDEQVGAAVREIHRESARVLDRYFKIRSVLNEEEGAAVHVPAGFDAGRYRLTGKLTGTAPFHGTLRHPGWEVTQSELPEFSGSESAAKTIAPAEVEIL
jgi:hypothetical protein